jgi:ATP-binding cassette subfamily C protein LapB
VNAPAAALGSFAPKSHYARCVLPLLDALGWKGDRNALAGALDEESASMDLDGLVDAMARLGFSPRAILLRAERVAPGSVPCLWRCGGRLFVVAERSGKDMLVFDPRSGAYATRPARGSGRAWVFSRLGSDSLSLLRPRERWFSRLLARFKGVFLDAVLIQVFLTLLSFIPPLFALLVYDRVFKAEDALIVKSLALGIGIYALGSALTRFARGAMTTWLGSRLGRLGDSEVFRRILFLPPSIVESLPAEAQLARIEEFGTVCGFFSGPDFAALLDLAASPLLLLGLALVSGPMALVPLAAFGLSAALGFAARPLARISDEASAEASARRAGFLSDVARSLDTVRRSGAARLWRERLVSLSSEACSASYRASRLLGAVEIANGALASAATTVAVALGVGLVLAGDLTTGGLIASILLVQSISRTARSGFGVVAQLSSLSKSVARIDSLMKLEQEEGGESSGPELLGALAFRQVTLRYRPEAAPALVDLDFEIPPGSVLILRGHDGSGKSSILKLALGFYRPQAGVVLVDGYDAAQLDPISLRRRVAYLPQSLALFPGSVAQNLRLSDPAASDEALAEACARAGVLDDLLSLPSGLDEDATGQRVEAKGLGRGIALARAYLRPSRLLLLDEPERGLGPAGIDRLLCEIGRIRGNTTVVVASESPRLLEAADLALVLDRGRALYWGDARGALAASRREAKGKTA